MKKHPGKAKVVPKNPDGIFLPFQGEWIRDESRLKLMEKSRQIGLSWSASYACNERTSLQGNKLDQWVSSRDDLQARLFIEDCKLWAKIMNFAANDLGEMVIDEKTRSSAYILEFPNGKRIHSMSSNPDAQAGKRGGRVLDEFALHPDPKKLWSIAYPGITWGGSLEIISTHRGSDNFFNELIREITERGNPKEISHHKVTLQRALEEGFLYKLQEKLPHGDSRQMMDEADYFDFIRNGCADEESFQQEFMCNPANDNVKFLEYGLITGCEYSSTEEWQRIEDGALFCGVDIGRKKDLTVLWVVEKQGDVFYTRHIESMEKMRKSEQEKILYPWFEKCQRVCIDATGLGIGWADDAQDKFGEHRVEAVTFTGAIKEILAYPVRNAMEDRKVRIPCDPKIRADLRLVKKTTTAAGNVRFVAESTDDGHADRFWALALAIHGGTSPITEYGLHTIGTRNDENTRRFFGTAADNARFEDMAQGSGRKGIRL